MVSVAPLSPPAYGRLVEDRELQKALDFLRDSAADLGEWKAEVSRADHMLKVVKAIEMQRRNDLSAARAESEAIASKEYKAALERLAVAVGEYEKLRALREAAALKIECWRTEQASLRSFKL